MTRKLVAFEIEIPEEFIKTQTEDKFLEQVAKKLKNLLVYVGTDDNSRNIINFTGQWEFIDTPRGYQVVGDEEWQRRITNKW